MLTLNDVLDLEWPTAPKWSSCGSFLAATVHEDDGKVLLVGHPGKEPLRVRPADEHVAEFTWSPTEPQLVCTTEDGLTALVDPREQSVSEIARTPDGDILPTWSHDGSRLAFYRDGKPRTKSLTDGVERGFDVPERGPFLGGERAFAWRGDGLLAYRFTDCETKCVGVINTESGDLVWRTRPDSSSHSPFWLDDGRLCYERRGEYGTVREFIAVDIDDPATESTLFQEVDEETGALSRGSPRLSPDGTLLAAALPVDGYEHIHVIDVSSGERTQLTEGAFEDKGLADSTPRWIDDERLVFASNRRDTGQRQLYTVTLDGTTEPLVETAGTNVEPRPSPAGDHVAYLHASRDRSPEVRVRELESDSADAAPTEPATQTDAKLTHSGLRDWPEPPIEPERVSFESGELTIEGYLLDPRQSESVPDDATDLPSVVYVHGGPMRQIRDGFHPSRSYGLAYAYQQYLATNGYVGLFVNYRGGIGYGRAFRGAIGGDRGRVEMDDIARAADYLRALEYTADSVGQWGLSYGGYAALQLPGTHPGTFDVTVNIAGLADTANYHEWATETKFPAIASAATTVMGHPLENPDRWDDASPVTHMDRYETPVYNFHGTADRYVNVEQQDIVVNTLLDLDVEFEAEYYPDEGHVFSKRSTWRRTFEKIEAAFDEHL
ncbi:peptidase S9 prolyl oligopeptidase active site domain-containing protein [Natrialba magadii ATCC 43099]|nr:prolyl oligopeptidase family serine peptidase [Natrialba magadii]ELY26539.1 peptidase S9 prolyl oligopeptidase active site domain-containing protein [Natrialba magadii ATCC 43099]